MGNPKGGRGSVEFFHALAYRKFLMKKLNFSRKIDEQGRISLPVKYRELVGLNSGTVVDFYEHKSNGHLYLCIQVPDELVDDVTEEQAENAKYILEKYLLQQKERKQKS